MAFNFVEFPEVFLRFLVYALVFALGPWKYSHFGPDRSRSHFKKPNKTCLKLKISVFGEGPE